MKYCIDILIADDNVDFGDLLKKYLNQHDDINVVGVARNGAEAVDMIVQLEPDLVVLDIIMPELDGLGVLEKIQKIRINKKPYFIVLSAIGQDALVQKAVLLGADYYVLKPFDVEMLVSRIHQIYEGEYTLNANESGTTKRNDKTHESMSVEAEKLDIQDGLKTQITNLMCSVGIQAHLTGYRYIREAVLEILTVYDKEYYTVTKHLYPSIARKFGTTPQRVERSIRNAIQSAWKTGNSDVLKSFLNQTISRRKGKSKEYPTNFEFVAALADKVKMVIKEKEDNHIDR